MASDENLVHYDPDKKVILASQVGIGAVLLNELEDGTQRPICFASETLSTAEKNYSVIHKEALTEVYYSFRSQTITGFIWRI